MSATRFVVTCFGRTGSLWLCSLLGSHPGVLCHGEIFNPKNIQYARRNLGESRVARAWTIDSRDQEPEAFLEAVLSEDHGHQAVGIKMLNWQQTELIFDLARRRDVHKVILRRRNRVRAFLSRTRSKTFERWMVESYDGVRIRLDPAELVNYVERYDAFYDQLRAATSGTPAIEIVYEDLLQDEQSALEIVDFLGVERSDIRLSSWMSRQSDDLTRDVVVNFAELSKLLRGTTLHAELHE